METRLIVYVGLSLLLASSIMGIFTYGYVYRLQLEAATSLQQQLVRTVQAQAEVAAFAANKEIAQGVLSGLLANPTIQAVRIESADGFKLEQASHQGTDFDSDTTYPLYSPVSKL